MQQRVVRVGGCGCGCGGSRYGGCGCGPSCPGCDCGRYAGNGSVSYAGSGSYAASVSMAPAVVPRPCGVCAVVGNRRVVPAQQMPTRVRFRLGGPSRVVQRRFAGGVSRPTSIPFKALRFREMMLQLWMEHGALTYAVLLAKVHNLPTEALLVQRLLTNQDNIGYPFALKFGVPVGNKVSELLREHIAIAGQIIDSLIGRPAPAVETLQASWAKNGWEIADALFNLQSAPGANRVGDLSAWRRHMTYGAEPGQLDVENGMGHLDILTRLVVAYVKGDYIAAHVQLDPYLRQAAEMAVHMAALFGPQYA